MKTTKIFIILLAALFVSAGGCTSTASGNSGSSEKDSFFIGDTLTSSSREQDLDRINGYDFELWNQRRQGTATMTPAEVDGAFKCSWKGIENVLFRAGKKYNRSQTHSQIGVFSIEYDAPVFSVTSGSIAYLSVYGWVDNPLIEYYIVDSWGTTRPPGSWTGAGSKGKVTIDGGTYDIYETTRTNQPSINGTQTFKQYWSVRTSKRTSGTISISEHFDAWAEKGMTGIRDGKFYEVALKIEGYQSNGSAEITKNILSINGVPIE
ncbi:MAG: glycoside hydrolase family 11 protein [Treponema sp.]|jgi:endo-1,4-beta-xylanase|nr:glycoside hydrolase family 11 protein [Treponema sp.]